jgi:FtsZ-interacting cell division protein ZipA
MPMWLIWVIVAVVVVVAIVAIVMMANKKRTEQRRTEAEALRTDASTHAGGLTESQRSAEEARAQAELARAEADRAAERAAAAEQGHQVEQATYEDKLREADRVDPDVNTKSADYEPSVWNDQSTADGSTSASVDDPSGSHRAGPDATTTSEDTTGNQAPTERPRTTE